MQAETSRTVDSAARSNREIRSIRGRGWVKVTQLCSLGAFVGILTLGACGVAGSQTRSGVSTTTEPPTTTTTVPRRDHHSAGPRARWALALGGITSTDAGYWVAETDGIAKACTATPRAAWRPLQLCPHRGHRRSSGKHVGLLVAGRRRAVLPVGGASWFGDPTDLEGQGCEFVSISAARRSRLHPGHEHRGHLHLRNRALLGLAAESCGRIDRWLRRQCHKFPATGSSASTDRPIPLARFQHYALRDHEISSPWQSRQTTRASGSRRRPAASTAVALRPTTARQWGRQPLRSWRWRRPFPISLRAIICSRSLGRSSPTATRTPTR